ncbi:MAG: nucleoside triphosphate pyrophosphohydrolase [Treponema sp.]|jgi:tetrapyrrole methylase family protein/MazG family protein|nr:nucleoside triphosphate pyrophosphohydrolase [Treponema sp.]
MAANEALNEAFKALYDIVVKLRSPDGCKWDREQTPSSLRGALIEETYECLEAIGENDPAHIAEELGDLFLVTTMIGYMYEQEGRFSVADTLKQINEKLIRRHPHVFGSVKVKNSAEILNNWAAIKVQEGRKPKDSILDKVSSGLPPMDRSCALQKKAAKVSFDWPDAEGVITKIQEELNEVQLATGNELEEELGDLLFSVINLCRFLKVDPSVALHQTNIKFVKRFKYMEKKMKETNKEMTKENLDIMEGYWNEAKGL